MTSWVAAAVVVAAIAGIPSSTVLEPFPPSPCHRYVAGSGNDHAPGSSARPYRTVRRLLRSLGPGLTGCLRGTVVEDVTIRRGGRGERTRLTLTSDPRGAPATLRGRLFITDTANFVTIRRLVLDGRPAQIPRRAQLPSPTVNGDRVEFLDNEVTNANTGICFVLGAHDAPARRTVIGRNRIHHCGRLPPTNHEHGVYVAVARDTVIRDNLVYANADRGVQLYPAAYGTLVENNVIDGNGTGVLFAGAGRVASSANVVRNNVITNSADRYDLAYFWEEAVGVDNVASGNCVWGGVLGEIEGPQGFAEFDNVRADPQYVDRDAGDFRLRPGSPCAGKGPR